MPPSQSSLHRVEAVNKPTGFLWAFGMFWTTMSLFFVVQTWTQSVLDWYSRLFSSAFLLIGLGVLTGAIWLGRKNRLTRGTELLLTQDFSYAGEDLSCELFLPPTYVQGQATANVSHEMQLVQYEEDRSGSGVSHIRVHAISQTVMPTQLADGRWRLNASFDVPADAPASGSVRNGNKVYWQIESVSLAKHHALEFPVVLRAARLPQVHASAVRSSVLQSSASAAPFSEAQNWPAPGHHGKVHDLSEIEPLQMGEQPQPMPTSVVRIHENTKAWSASFPRRLWKLLSIALTGFAIYMLLDARALIHTGYLEDLLYGFFKWCFVIALLVAAFHAWTKRWILMVVDDGYAVDTSSALVSKVVHYSTARARPLIRKHSYDSQTNSNRTSHYSLCVRHENLPSKLQAITPSLPGLDFSAAMAHHFWQALEHRRMRFTADGQEIRHQLGTGGLKRLGAWVVLSSAALVSGVVLLISPKVPLSDLLQPGQIQAELKKQNQRFSAQGLRHSSLLKAHRYNSAAMVEQALADGADANAVGSDGVSLLIEAADAGELGIVRAHLKHGADVNVRNTTDPNKRGDTPLLVALYRGHWDVAQLLIESGADMKAKNRWDWGSMHMAAQSDCIPCLEALLAQGFSPNEPAPASKGESPVMLAAGKDKLPALKWLVANGGSLQQKDPQGQNALAWAEFFKRSNTAVWIRTQPASAP